MTTNAIHDKITSFNIIYKDDPIPSLPTGNNYKMLGKIINYEEKCIFERMCWHDGPIYNSFCNFIEFENSNRIDDLELIDKLKNLDEDNKKYIIDNYSNPFIV